jgi:aerobic-type carbon monoxide dehydrogenase small subunit (CoxS/CutS family)
VIAAKSLLEENPTPTEDEIKDYMMGNLCRCNGYYGILNSIAAAAKIMNEAAGNKAAGSGG